MRLHLTPIRPEFELPRTLQAALTFLNEEEWAQKIIGRELPILKGGVWHCPVEDPCNQKTWWGVFQPDHLLIAIATHESRTVGDYVFTIVHEFRHVNQYRTRNADMWFSQFYPPMVDELERDADECGHLARTIWLGKCHAFWKTHASLAPRSAPRSRPGGPR